MKYQNFDPGDVGCVFFVMLGTWAQCCIDFSLLYPLYSSDLHWPHSKSSENAAAADLTVNTGRNDIPGGQVCR